jgi:pantetheine-phosphate adenylyltransferase
MTVKRIALYPGSFDPVTLGHVDVIERAAKLFDKLIVGVGVNRSKEPLFTPEARKSHLLQACSKLENVEVSIFSGLLAHAVQTFNATAVIRGLRAVSDFEGEFQMALMNRELNPDCETVFLMPSPQYSFLSSTMICEIASLGGDVSPFVPSHMLAEIKAKFGM